MRWIERQHAVLVLRVVALMALYSLFRVVFYLANADHFADMSAPRFARILYGGLRFDLSAVLYVNFAYLLLAALPLRARHHIFYRRVLDALFVATNAVAMATNCADLVYFRFTGGRTTAELFSEFANEYSFASLLLSLSLEYWPATLGWLVTIAFFWQLTRAAPHPQAPEPSAPLRYYGVNALLFVAVVFFTLVGCRGGFFVRNHRPITNSYAGAYVDDPGHVPLVLNSPFSIIRTLDKSALEERRDFASEAELALAYTPEHQPAQGATPKAVNVVVIILESFGPNAIGALDRQIRGGDQEGYTPFLDSLMQRCRSYSNAFANGVRSIEALPPIVAGIPNLKQRFVLSHYYNNRFEGLGTHLGRMGYRTAFFHGAPRGSMGFDAFVKTAGFREYFGLEEYAREHNGWDDYDGDWGIWDEEFFQFFASKLDTFEQPFLAGFFSITSHSPFKVPERYQGKFKKGPGRAEETMGYTDFALRRFFERAEKSPWFADTLFVITSDHAAVQRVPEYKNKLGRFRVPMLLCHAKNPSLSGWDARVVQHSDVMPTVLRYVGYDQPFVAFGQDMLASAATPMAVSYNPPNGPYQLITHGHALHFDGQRSLGLYRWPADLRVQHNVISESPDVAASMERTLRAVVQQYNNRMRSNRLTPTTLRAQAP